MTMFAVYCPPGATPEEAPEALRFVAERPSLWAFLAPPLWLLARRLWLGLAFWLVGAAAVWALTRGLAPEPRGVIRALAWLWFAFAARDIEQSSLARAGWALAALVDAPSRAAAEIRFFDRAVAAPAASAERRAATGGGRGGVIGFEAFGDTRR